MRERGIARYQILIWSARRRRRCLRFSDPTTAICDVLRRNAATDLMGEVDDAPTARRIALMLGERPMWWSPKEAHEQKNCGCLGFVVPPPARARPRARARCVRARCPTSPSTRRARALDEREHSTSTSTRRARALDEHEHVDEHEHPTSMSTQRARALDEHGHSTSTGTRRARAPN